MTDATPRSWEIFLEVFEALPRQGPGSRACAQRALALCRDVPPAPVVLDLGCGTGGQTLQLAELTGGSIVAVDALATAVTRLARRAAARGLSHRIRPVVGDIAHAPFAEARFDLVWSEGALYNVGIERALQTCRTLLRAGGHLVFTDAVWRKADPPPEVKACFDQDYPAMGRAEDVLAAVGRCGFSTLGHFTLPDEAWWDDFYTPMQRRLEELRGRHAGDREALAVLDQIAAEPEMYRRYSDYYAYEFFAARRDG
jgi:SAM-dependent methyltransferase